MSSFVAGSCDETTLRVLNPDLPLLASQAAVEIDNLSAGKITHLKAVRILAGLLENSFVERDPSEGEPVFDPSAVVVVGRALKSCERWKSLARVDQVVETAREISSSLKSLSEQEEKEKDELEKLRAFCTALSRSASAYLQSAFNLEPVDPYER